MNTSLPRSLSLLAIISVFLIPTSHSRAQGRTPTLRSNTPSDIERDDPRVVQIIEKAENHFKQGELNLKDRNGDLARSEFDKAVDVVLESGMDVRANPRLQTYYLQLVERVYRMEIPTQTQGVQVAMTTTQSSAAPRPVPQTGFLREQVFEPSALDELARLELSKEAEALHTSVSTCTVAKSNSIKLRGFNLGMSLAELRNKLPTLRMSLPDAYGHSSGIVAKIQMGSDPELKDTKILYFETLDARVTYIAVIYDDSVRWNSLDEFTSHTAEALKLPTEWTLLNIHSAPYKYINCADFLLLAGFFNFDGHTLPMLQLHDTNSETTYRNRIAVAKEKRALEEEKKRRSFKP